MFEILGNIYIDIYILIVAFIKFILSQLHSHYIREWLALCSILAWSAYYSTHVILKQASRFCLQGNDFDLRRS